LLSLNKRKKATRQGGFFMRKQARTLRNKKAGQTIVWSAS
jgi:hypothetical protein